MSPSFFPKFIWMLGRSNNRADGRLLLSSREVYTCINDSVT